MDLADTIGTRDGGGGSGDNETRLPQQQDHYTAGQDLFLLLHDQSYFRDCLHCVARMRHELRVIYGR